MKDFETRGWTDEDFYKINSVEDLMNMYIGSCGLRFINQLDYTKDGDEFISIIPQFAFTDDKYFDEDLARKAFIQ